MARGWEKEQVDPPEKPEPASPAMAAAEARVTERDRQRRLQGLQLQRERILSETHLKPAPPFGSGSSVLEIEEQLFAVGWTIHI